MTVPIPCAVLGAVLDEFRAQLRAAFDATSDQLQLPLDELARGYKNFAGDAADDDIRLVTWVTAKLGPSFRGEPTAFELLLSQRLDDQANRPRIVVPGWLLSVPCRYPVGTRLPANPILDDLFQDEETRLTYSGLVAHIDHRNEFDGWESPEVALSSIIWRAAALFDYLSLGLTAEDAGLAQRAGLLRRDCTAGNFASMAERDLWRVVDRDFVDRRHVLSHLEPTSGRTTTVATAIEWCLGNRAEVYRVAACVAHAVLTKTALDVRSSPPPRTDGIRWMLNYA